MITVDFKIDGKAIQRKIIEAAEKQVNEKLRNHGIFTVTAKAIGAEGDGVRLEFSGPDEDVKKAKEFFGSSER